MTCEHDPRERNAEKRTRVRGRVGGGGGGREESRGEEGSSGGGRGWSNDENDVRVHRLGDEEGTDRGEGGAGTCSGADLLDPGGLQIRRDQRNQRAVPTSVVQARMKREIDRKKERRG